MVAGISLFPLIAAILSGVLVIVGIVVPARQTRSTTFFILLNAASVAWSVAYFLRLNYMPGIDPALARPGTPQYLILLLWALGEAGCSTYWFLFGAEQAGWSRWTHGPGLWVSHLPLLLTLAASLTNTSHHLFVEGMRDGVVVLGPLAWIHNVVMFTLGTTGFLLFMGSLWKRPESRRIDVVSLGLSAVVPYAGSIMWMTRGVTHVAAEALAVPVLQPLGNIVLTVLVFRTGIADIMPDGMLRTIMENTDAQLAYLNTNLQFVSANSAFLARTGLTEDELAGRRFEDIVRNSQLIAVVKHARELREAVEHRAWPDVLGDDGGAPATYANWSLRPVKSATRLRGFVFSVTDVTDEVRDAAFSTALGRLTRRLHSSLDPDATLPSVVASAGEMLKADVCSLVLGSPGTWRWVRACEGDPSWEAFDPKAWSHFRLAIEMRRPVVIPDASKASLGLEGHEVETDIRRILTVPLILKGEVAGAVSFGSYSPGHYSPAQIAFVHELTRIVVGALENAGRYHSQREIANTLQDALLRLPERIPGIELASAYRSATRAARVGGDLYDLFELDGTTVALVIADMSGKGVEAAGLSQILKTTLRSEAMRFASPGQVLTVTNELLRRQFEVGTFATAFFGMLELDSGLLRYASAGHPGPFVLRREGQVERLERTPGLLGVFEGIDFPCHETALQRGDVVLMYTDGLIETRKRDSPVEEDLRPFLSTLASREPAEVVEAVLGHSTEECGGELKDDVAVLAVRLA